MAPAANSTTIANSTAWLNSRKGARCFKFPATQQDFDMFNRHQQNDYPLFRLADIVLMKAECLLRGATATNGDTPASLMNIVRRCSGAPDVTGTPTIQDLMDERLRELIMKPWRRNDLIRNGMFENDWAWKNGWYVDGVWHERVAADGTPARDKPTASSPSTAVCSRPTRPGARTPATKVSDFPLPFLNLLSQKCSLQRALFRKNALSGEHFSLKMLFAKSTFTIFAEK